MKRKCLSFILMIVILLCMLPMSVPVLAKTSLPGISKNTPIFTYTYKSSGKIYRYTDSSLKTKESGHWIDCANDECKIIEIQNDAVKVIYPTSSGPKTGWFVRSEFCKGDLKANQSSYSFKATKKITTYRWKENNTVYGYVSKGDKTYLLRGNQNSNWLQILYPVSGGYKMAWVKGDDLFANSITLNKSSISKQNLGWTETLTATLSPSDSADSVTWKSSNTSVVTVTESGVASGVGYGTAVITASTKRGKSASCTVSIIKPSTPKHYIDLNCILDGNEKYDLVGIGSVDIYINGSLDASNVTDYYKEWPEGTIYEARNIKTNSGYTYEGERNGKLSGTVGTGTVGIWLVYKTNKSATVPVSGIKLSKSSASINVGKTVSLTATVSPSNATNKKVTWSSSNAKVATVSSGTVKGVSAGTATITAKSSNGKAATCKVTVIKKTNGIVSEDEIKKAAKAYGIKEGTKAYKALNLINTRYASKVDNKKGLNLFLFEGAGNNKNTSKREYAMLVVVKKGKIVWINRNCSTIPDYPFDKKRNGGTYMPTLKSGVYHFKPCYHKSSYYGGKYAALKITDDKVVRYISKNKFKDDVSGGINIHRKVTDAIAPKNKTWANSAGCQLIGKTNEYVTFIKKIGLITDNWKKISDWNVKGNIIVDRSYAYDYLKSIGYTDAHIKRLEK